MSIEPGYIYFDPVKDDVSSREATAVVNQAVNNEHQVDGPVSESIQSRQWYCLLVTKAHLGNKENGSRSRASVPFYCLGLNPMDALDVARERRRGGWHYDQLPSRIKALSAEEVRLFEERELPIIGVSLKDARRSGVMGVREDGYVINLSTE